MCVGMCIHMRVDMCADLCVDVYVDMRADVCVDEEGALMSGCLLLVLTEAASHEQTQEVP